MEHTVNRVQLRGTLVALPVFSHENHARRFYRFALEVERLSGAVDVLPVLAAEDVLNDMELFSGSRIAVTGQIRSFNSRAESGRRLILSVYAESLDTSDLPPENDVQLTGAICKTPVYRRTPLGREICDVMLAVSRLYRRSDYIPCILWGRAAQQAALLAPGAVLELEGRMQSRNYTKLLPTGAEQRTAYEVSATQAWLDGENLQEFGL